MGDQVIDVSALANEIATRALNEARDIIDRAFGSMSTQQATQSKAPAASESLSDRIVRLWRTGASGKDVAKAAGTTPGNVYQVIFQRKKTDPTLRRYRARGRR